jgi:AcrR family transcriptional regulator
MDVAMRAEQAGISEAGLLHHFPSKQDLLLRADVDTAELARLALAVMDGVTAIR